MAHSPAGAGRVRGTKIPATSLTRPVKTHYQFKRKENWIWREFSAEVMFPKLEVP
jgi:hypothetical protein